MSSNPGDTGQTVGFSFECATMVIAVRAHCNPLDIYIYIYIYIYM